MIHENIKALAEEKQVFISVYLQDLHIYLSAIPSFWVPSLKLVKDMEFDDSKFCRIVEDPLLYKQGTKQLFYKCNRIFTINRVCLDLQYYKLISLSFKNDENQTINFGRKIALGLIQGFKMNKKFADTIIISKTLEWVSDGSLLPTQHNVSFHYQNRRPTMLSYPLEHSDICVEPLINQIRYWRVRIISRDFETYPKNMGYLIAANPFQQIFCNKKIDLLLTKSISKDIKLLDKHRRDYIFL